MIGEVTMRDVFAFDHARSDELVLVDALDRELGVATKERVHREGLLHRAFSVVLVRERSGAQELLLARRAMSKYHAAGLWGNSCCSHPRKGESIADAACRRVGEELGMSIGAPQEIGSFVYRAAFANGLVEYEYDHVLVGTCAAQVNPALEEVDSVWWIDTCRLGDVLAHTPQVFAPWALTVLPMTLAYLNS